MSMFSGMIRLLVVLAVMGVALSSSVSVPLKEGDSISKVIPDYFDSKSGPRTYHNSTPIFIDTVSHIDPSSSCDLNFHVAWATHVGSPIYSNSAIFASGNDGSKGIYLNTYYNDVEILGGAGGHKPWGWPVTFEDSVFSGSPILFDVDADGTDDVGVVDKNGNVFFIRIGEYGQYLEDYHIQVPRLRVKRDWYKGLDENYVDNFAQTSMFDKTKAASPASSKSRSPADADGRPKGGSLNSLSGLKPKPANGNSNKSPEVKRKPSSSSSSSSSGGNVGGGIGRRLSEVSNDAEEKPTVDEKETNVSNDAEEKPAVGEKETNVSNDAEEKPTVDEKETNVSNDAEEKPAVGEKETNVKTPQNADPVDVDPEIVDPGIPDFFGVPDFGEGSNMNANEVEHGHDADVASRNHDIEGGIADIDFGEGSGEEDDYIVNMQRMYAYEDPELQVGDDVNYQYMGGFDSLAMNDTNSIFVDAHVLASVTLADVNNDGKQELIIPISYYFDKAEYMHKSTDFSPEMYVAGGVACWDLVSQQWMWTVHLDLSTDKTHYKALIKSSPTVADIDGDGRSEIIIGTSMGLLYVLDGDTGFTRRFFPMQFHAIEAQTVAADVWGGDDLEIIVADMAGNLVVLDIDGEILWDRTLSGTLPFTPSIGDVDGDGVVDIVVVAQRKDGCHIWALNGQTGANLEGYPLALPSKATISSSILLVDLHDYRHPKYQKENIKSDPHLPSWIYQARSHDYEPVNGDYRSSLSEAQNQAAEVFLNSSEHGGVGASYLSSFANKKRFSQGLHMIVPSFDGHVYFIDSLRGCADTIEVGEHISSVPLADDVTGDGNLDIVIGTLNGQILAIETDTPYHTLNAWNSFPKNRHNGFTHGVMGISVPFTERRALQHADVLGQKNMKITFDIWDNRLMEKEDKMKPRSYTVSIARGTNKVKPLHVSKFRYPGRYTVTLQMEPPEAVTLVLSMVNDHGQHFEDTVSVSIATRFYVWFKYLIVAPVIIMTLPLFLIRKKAP